VVLDLDSETELLEPFAVVVSETADDAEPDAEDTSEADCEADEALLDILPGEAGKDVGIGAPAPPTGRKSRLLGSLCGNGERFLIKRLRFAWSRCWICAFEEVVRVKTRAV